MKEELEALEKIDHTVCLAFNENNNALFNKDKYEHIDCKDIYEFVECYDIVEKALKEYKQYKDFVQEICNYLGLDNLFPYSDLKEIEKQIKTMADNSHWIVVKQDQKKLKALEIIKNDFNLFLNAERWKVDMHKYEQMYKENYDLLKEALL